MKLTQRESTIIIELKRSPNGVTGARLSKQMGVSAKTVQNDVKSINSMFENPIIQSSNRGYSLVADDINLDMLTYEWDDTSHNNQLLEKILLKNEVYNYADLADELNISESNLQVWIKECNDFLDDYNLSIVRSRGTVSLAGNEIDVRTLINHMIYSELNTNIYQTMHMQKYYGEVNEDELLEVLNNFLESRKLHIASYYQTNIYMNLLSIFDRIVNQLQVDIVDCEIDRQSDEYALATMLCDFVGEKYQVSICESEIHFIASFFVGQLKDGHNEAIFNLNSDFVKSIEAILAKAFTHYMLEPSYDDFLLVFSAHVHDLIKRTQTSHKIPNMHATSIKDHCPFIYEVAVYVSQLIEEQFFIHLSEDEINLISIHIGYSIDAMRDAERIKCVIYHSKYQNNERVIVHKILNKFRADIHIVQVKNDFQHLIEDCSMNLDTLFISTVPNMPVRDNLCVISPIVSEYDMGVIDEYLTRMKLQDNRMNLRELVRKYTDPSLFYTSLPSNQQKEIIHYLADDLEQKDIVSKDFALSVLERESKSSTCFFERFAIPHALDSYAQKTAISVVVNQEEIHWGEHRIHVILLIALSDKDMVFFAKMYEGLINTFMCDDTFERITNAKDYEAFIACF